MAKYKNELYNLPFNMNTFHQMWGIFTPEEARSIIDRQKSEVVGIPKNLEEKAISLVGRDIYEKLIKGYTEKQWGRKCTELPAFIITLAGMFFVRGMSFIVSEESLPINHPVYEFLANYAWKMPSAADTLLPPTA
jgi:UDP-galactopyranose mutase